MVERGKLAEVSALTFIVVVCVFEKVFLQVYERFFEEVNQRLIKTYDPLEIYLFGSYAWGCPDEDSNLNLLVIVEKLDQDCYQALVVDHRALIGLNLSKDLLLLSKAEFEKSTQSATTLYSKLSLRVKKSMQEHEEWLYFAEQDLKAALFLFGAPEILLGPLLFHTQQCAEKALSL